MNKKKYFSTVLIALITSHLFAVSAIAKSTDKTNIEKVIQNYERALNNSDVKGVIAVYARNGVFMPSHSPTALGKEQIRAAYQHVFKTLDLNVVFNYDNIEQDNDIAYVRTTSKGDIKILESGVTVKNDIHRELFVLKMENGHWKISQYMFNKPNEH